MAGAGASPLPRAHRDEYRLEAEWVAPLLEDLLAAVAADPATGSILTSQKAGEPVYL